MTTQITIELSDTEYIQARHLAQVHHREVIDILKLAMNRGLLLVEDEEGKLSPISGRSILPARPQLASTKRATQRQQLAVERDAYANLHPQLKLTHWGQFVAIYRGELIDHDLDFGALVERVRTRYPNEIVLMTQVAHDPMRTITRRSPRRLPRAT